MQLTEGERRALSFSVLGDYAIIVYLLIAKYQLCTRRNIRKKIGK